MRSIFVLILGLSFSISSFASSFVAGTCRPESLIWDRASSTCRCDIKEDNGQISKDAYVTCSAVRCDQFRTDFAPKVCNLQSCSFYNMERENREVVCNVTVEAPAGVSNDQVCSVILGELNSHVSYGNYCPASRLFMTPWTDKPKTSNPQPLPLPES